MKYIKKPIAVEVITFEELVEHGKSEYARKGISFATSLPWSFQYQNGSVTHENDDCYLIATLEGTMRFNRGDYLITGVQGEIYPCKADIFEATYERVQIVDDETTEEESKGGVYQCFHCKATVALDADHACIMPAKAVGVPENATEARLVVTEDAAPVFEKVYCDCDQATECPNGKTGSADRCCILRKAEPLQDATYEPDLIAVEKQAIRPTFHQELVELINRHSIENRSGTPDWILGDLLMGVLRAYDLAIHCREEYHGRPSPLETISNG